MRGVFECYKSGSKRETLILVREYLQIVWDANVPSKYCNVGDNSTTNDENIAVNGVLTKQETTTSLCKH